MFRVHMITTHCLSSRGCGNKLLSNLRSSLLHRHHHHLNHNHHYRISKPCHSSPISRLRLRYYHPGHRGDVNNSWSRTDMIKYWSMIKQMFPYVWPKGKPSLRARVVIAVCLLIAAKVNQSLIVRLLFSLYIVIKCILFSFSLIIRSSMSRCHLCLKI